MESKIIKKPKTDTKKYFFFVLPNLMRVLLISDVGDKSAASMTIKVGSKDNENILGLNHMVEHSVFLGCEKFKSKNFFENFIEKNLGNENAFSDYDRTSFYFEISNEQFSGGFDRFCEIFKSPLFQKRRIVDEIEIVEEEFGKNLNDDYSRMLQMIKNHSNEDAGNKWRLFSMGNKKTLLVEKIEEEVRKFYEKYYTPDMMNLVMLSNESIETMKVMVEKKFGELILPENSVKKTVKKIPLPFVKNCKNNFFKIIPIEDKRRISLIFTFEFYFKEYRDNLIDYVRYIIDSEEKGSLFDVLQKKNYIYDLITNQIVSTNGFYILEVDIEITKLGEKNFFEVIKIFFQYVEFIEKKVSMEEKTRLFKELKQINNISFLFSHKIDPSKTVRKICKNVARGVKIEDILKGFDCYYNFDQKFLNKIFNGISKENMVVVWSSPKFREEAKNGFLAEKYYGTKYKVENFPLKKLDPPSQESFQFFKENQFIPKNLEILKQKKGEIEMIFKSEKIKVFYKPNTIYEQPISSFIFHLDFFNTRSLENYVRFALLTELIHDELRDIFFRAEMSFFNVSLKYSEEGIIFYVSGYNDTIELIIDKVFEKIFSFNESLQNKQRFSLIKDEFESYYENYKNFEILKKCSNFAMLFLDSSMNFYYEEYLSILKEIRVDNIINFYNNFMNGCHLTFLNIGYGKDRVSKLTQKIREKYLKKKRNIFQGEFYSLRKMIKLPPKSIFVFRKENCNEEDKCCCVAMYYQIGQFNYEHDIYLKLLNTIIPFYEIIRTKEKLGYNIGSYVVERFNVLYYKFYIQSKTKKSPNFLMKRILNFVSEYQQELKDIMKDEFFVEKMGVLKRDYESLKNFSNIGEECTFYWGEIDNERYKFNRYDDLINTLKTLKKEDFLEFYENFFVGNRAVHVVKILPKGSEEDKEKEVENVKIVKDYLRRKRSFPTFPSVL